MKFTLWMLSLFITFATFGVAFQNCGKNNPASVSDATVEQLGVNLIGKTYTLFKVKDALGNETFFNDGSGASIDLYLHFESGEFVTGKDGCNTFSAKIYWPPRNHREDEPRLEFYEVKMTMMACLALPVAFQVDQEFTYQASENELALSPIESPEVYFFH